MALEKPVGVAFIGTGSYANLLARAADDSPKIRIVSCYDPRKDAADDFAQKYSCKAVDLEEMLVDSSVDGVIICSPNNSHLENCAAAAEVGKHVFVDKPIANDIRDALAMIDACNQHNVILAVGHNGRRMPGHRQMKAMIEAGDIGVPVTAEANFSHAGGLRLTGSEWRASREACPALPLMQLGVHFADTLQYLVGDITEVSSFMTHIATKADNDDVTVSILKFQCGILGYLGSNYASPQVYYVNVYGTGGNIYCDGGTHLRYRKAGEKTTQEIPVITRDTQLEELEEFADCIRHGNKPEVDGEAAVKALAVVRAALESNDLKRPVTIQEMMSISSSAVE